MTAWPDFLGYPPATQSSRLVLVEKNSKGKPATRADAYKYVPPATPAAPVGQVDYSLPSFPVSQMPPYQIYPSSSDWRRPDASLNSTMMRANGEAVNSLAQRGMYRPAYLNSTERTDEFPAAMPPYLSSSQGFRPLDPSDISFQQPYQPRTNFY